MRYTVATKDAALERRTGAFPVETARAMYRALCAEQQQLGGQSLGAGLWKSGDVVKECSTVYVFGCGRTVTVSMQLEGEGT